MSLRRTELEVVGKALPVDSLERRRLVIAWAAPNSPNVHVFANESTGPFDGPAHHYVIRVDP